MAVDQFIKRGSYIFWFFGQIVNFQTCDGYLFEHLFILSSFEVGLSLSKKLI